MDPTDEGYDEDGFTALTRAASLGERDDMDALLAAGADVEEPKSGGYTALFTAIASLFSDSHHSWADRTSQNNSNKSQII